MVDAADAWASAHKAPHVVEGAEVDTSDIIETRFSGRNAVRGKYHEHFAAAAGLVRLDPDIREAFSDDASVNRTLREILKVAKHIRR